MLTTEAGFFVAVAVALVTIVAKWMTFCSTVCHAATSAARVAFSLKNKKILLSNPTAVATCLWVTSKFLFIKKCKKSPNLVTLPIPQTSEDKDCVVFILS